MNHIKISTVISSACSTQKIQKLHTASRIILSILGLFLFSTTIIQSTYNVGTLDTTANGGTGFGSGTPGSATGYVVAGFTDTMNLNASAIQRDGKIVVVGANLTNGQAVVARYNINGTEDVSFGEGFYVSIAITGYTNIVATGVAIQADGKIVVVGNCVTTGGEYPSAFVARYLPNGFLDMGFGSQGFFMLTGSNNEGEFSTDYYINAVAIQPSDQKIVIAGQLINDGTSYILVGRIDTAGVSSSFNNNLHPGSINIANGVALHSNEKIVIVGQSDANMIVARYTTNLDLDTTFNPTPGTPGYNLLQVWTTSNATVAYAVGFQKQGYNAGKIVVAGGYTPSGQAFLARFTTDGLLDTTAPNGFGFTFDSGETYLGYTSNGFGVSAAAKGCVIQNDDKIVISGYNFDVSGNTNFLIAQWLADGRDLDPDFANRQGDCTTNISNPNYGHSLSLQQNGSFIVAGTIGSGDTQTATARYLGNQGVQGCMDISYNPAIAVSPGTPGFCINPTDVDPADAPYVTALQVLSDNSVFVVDWTTGCQLVKFDADGFAITNVLEIVQQSATDVIVDAQGRALVVGDIGEGELVCGWLARYTATAGTPENPGILAADLNFNFTGDVIQNVDFTGFVRVGLLSDGTIVAVGQLAESTSCGYQLYNTAGVAVDSAVPIANGDVTDVLISSSDVIYFAVQQTEDTICIYSLDNELNEFIDTGWDVEDYGAPLMAFDSAGNIIICAVGTSLGNAGELHFSLYNANGTPIVLNTIITSSTTFLSNPEINRLQCDTNDRPIFAGQDDNGYFVGRLLPQDGPYIFDTTFAPYATVPGLLITRYDDAYGVGASLALGIAPSGAILFGGYENLGEGGDLSFVGQVVGDAGVGQNARYPFAAGPGDVDTSFGTNGVLAVLGGQTIKPETINVLSNGNILVSVSVDSKTIVGLTSSYTLNSTGGSAFGVGNTGVTATLAGAFENIKNVMVAVDGTLYVVGDNGINSAVQKLSANGATLLWETTNDTANIGNCVTQQASGRILMGGYDPSYESEAGSGVIIAYNQNTGAVDTSFNPGGNRPGSWYTGVPNPITSISVGALGTAYADKIYFSYASESDTAVVDCLLENGTELYPNFTFETALANNSANDIRMQLDKDGKIVLVSTTTSYIVAARYAANGANDVTTLNVSPSLSLPPVKNILCLSTGETLILGQDTANNYIILTRLAANFTLDSSFGTGGTTYQAVGSVTQFYALGIATTGSFDILVTGDNGSNPYFVGILSGYESAVTAVTQSTTATPAASVLDTTFNAAAANPGYMDVTSLYSSSDYDMPTIAKVLLQTSTGDYFIAADSNGQNQTSITKMSDDDIQYANFGNSSVMVVGGTNVAAMLLGQSDIESFDHEVFFVAGGSGSSGSNAGWIYRINQDDGYNNPQFEVTDTLDIHCSIAQQSNGRILVAGYEGIRGTLIAYDPVTGAVDTTFGDGGRYVMPNTNQINSVIVDADDYIYFTTTVNSNVANNENMQVIKLAPNGVVDSNNLAAVVWNYIFDGTQVDATNNFIAFDSDNNVYVVGGRLDNSLQILFLNSSTGNLITHGAFWSLGSLTSAVVDASNKLVITGYNINGGNSPYIARIVNVYTPGVDLYPAYYSLISDTTFNIGGYQSYTIPGTTATSSSFYGAMINANGKITIAGYGATTGGSPVNTPYTMRIYGDEFIGQYAPLVAPGVEGNIDTNFAVNGYLSLTTVSTTALPVVVLPVADGNQYVLWNNVITQAGYVTRFTNGNVLDTTYGPNSDGYSASCFPGATAMIMDGNGGLVLVGVNIVTGFGWMSRFLADGNLDSDFGTAGTVTINPDQSSVITSVIQQTSARYIVAGQKFNTSTATLWAFTDTGDVDETFNSQSVTPGEYEITGASIYALVTDEYDRIIIAYLNGSDVDITRLTPSGELDVTFGDGGEGAGTIASAITNATDATQIRLALDASGNIVLAAAVTTGIQIIAYANTTGTALVESPYTITNLTNPVLTNLIATEDDKVLVGGNQSDMAFTMWVARFEDNQSGVYELDLTFNENELYGVNKGIMQFGLYASQMITGRNLASIGMYSDGTISMIGTETNNDNGTTTVVPFMSRAYDNPYTAQTLACLNSKPAGTSDQTFGVTNNVGNGIAFYGSQSSGEYDSDLSQRAKAVAMQDDQNIVVAIEGSVDSAGQDIILLNVFNVDGLLNPNFNTAGDPYYEGQALVLSMFDGQYVNDMLTFTTADGINKAILAGLAFSNTLDAYGSLVMQYDLTNAGLDSTFGGLNGNSWGVAFGDGKQANVLGLQSNGRIIVGGLNQSDQGLLLGYNTVGNLDQGFGQGGTFTQDTMQAGIFAQAIDAQDRIVIAYNDGDDNVALARILSDGSDLDPSFNPNGTTPGIINVEDRISGVSDSANIRLAFDQNQNIILAAVIEDFTAIQLNVWDPNGSDLTASLTIDDTSPYYLSLAGYTLSKLMVDTNGKTIIVGYDSNAYGQGIIVRTGADALTPDTTFNADDTPGYLRFKIGDESYYNLAAFSGIVHPDGRIIIPGARINID